MSTIRKTYDKIKIDFLLDAAIFLAFLIAMDPHSTGIAIHEWLSIAFAGAVMAHLLLHWNWIVGITRRFLGAVTLQARANYILNLLLFIDMTAIIFSGLMISESALPALGISLQPGFFWRHLHDLTANIALLLIGLHLALHWRWIVSTTNKYLRRSFRPTHRLNPAPTPVEVKSEVRR